MFEEVCHPEIMMMLEESETGARTAIVDLPLGTRFKLGPEITDVQLAFLERHGFLIFDQVISADEVASVLKELDEIQAEWLAKDKQSVRGIPIFWGQDENGQPFVQRFAFLSHFSKTVNMLVHDKRFEAVKKLIGGQVRVGTDEKDGVVLNRFINVAGSIYKRLGWHTDGLRDLFYLRMPKRMLNVGLHYNDIEPEDGGLRLIPGSHNQGFFKMCFGKMHFVSHRPDRREIMVRTKAGDLTVHDGRLWHRVAQSSKKGKASLRHSMYVPFLTDTPMIKDETSKTPFYHHLGRFMRWCKRLFS